MDADILPSAHEEEGCQITESICETGKSAADADILLCQLVAGGAERDQVLQFVCGCEVAETAQGLDMVNVQGLACG